MAFQLGRCAFTAACNHPGPRIRIPGTNRTVCPPHARIFQLAMESPAPAASEAEPAVMQLLRFRRNRGGE